MDVFFFGMILQILLQGGQVPNRQAEQNKQGKKCRPASLFTTKVNQ